ncbi:band 4.1-like protein 4 isoform X1 [Lates japonicus]
MACFRGNREEFYGEVLLLDETKILLTAERGIKLWLDPSKTLSQHRELIGPPYIFYFGVRFYAEDPSKLKEETRFQFYLQLCQDIRRGRLLCPPPPQTSTLRSDAAG